MVPEVVTAEFGADDRTKPLVVLLHGRGSSESEIISLAQYLPQGFHYVAVRAPISEGGGYAWFANRGIGRPIASSIRSNIDWFRNWFDDRFNSDRPTVLIGFSGGAAFAGGLTLDDPARFSKTAILFGTLPWDADLPTESGHLKNSTIFFARGLNDSVIPAELMDRTQNYLESESGSALTKVLTPGGHGITQDVIDKLSAWLS